MIALRKPMEALPALLSMCKTSFCVGAVDLGSVCVCVETGLHESRNDIIDALFIHTVAVR